MPDIVFPDHFVWGTATAAHQIEGGNVNNDWWVFEHDPTSGCADVSGDACDSFNRFAEDIALVAGLGLSSYRFSLEWSRIEPEEGEFSRVALDHYRRMAAACHEHGVMPVVTFHHFTHPRWLAAGRHLGGSPGRGPLRPLLRTGHRPHRRSDRHGRAPSTSRTWWPPWDGGSGSSRRGCGTGPGGARSTTPWSPPTGKAVEAIRSGPGDFPVGLTLSMTDYQLQPGGEEWLERIRRPSEDVFLEATGGDDFIGVQTYTRMRVGPDGALGGEEGVPTTQMGYEFWPEALEGTIRRAWDKTGGLPVYVTENGIGTD